MHAFFYKMHQQGNLKLGEWRAGGILHGYGRMERGAAGTCRSNMKCFVQWLPADCMTCFSEKLSAGVLLLPCSFSVLFPRLTPPRFADMPYVSASDIHCNCKCWQRCSNTSKRFVESLRALPTIENRQSCILRSRSLFPRATRCSCGEVGAHCARQHWAFISNALYTC